MTVNAQVPMTFDRRAVREAVDEFLAHKRLAFVGLSTDEKQFSRSVCATLRERGYEVVPVNPAATEIDGMRCYNAVGEITPPVDGALIMTPPDRAADIVAQCDRAGIRRVWLHRGVGTGAVSQDALSYCAAHSMSVVPGECPLMFVGDPPAAVHRVHAVAKKIAGTYPTREASTFTPAVLIYGAAGWALCGLVMYLAMAWLPMTAAIVIHAAAAPLIFGALTYRYYGRRATPSPFVTAATFTLTTIALDVVVVALLIERSFEMFASPGGTWIPFALILTVSWAVAHWRRPQEGALGKTGPA